MAKSTVTTPVPPLTRAREWPNPQLTQPQKPPNQASVNKPPPIFPVPRGGGGNS